MAKWRGKAIEMVPRLKAVAVTAFNRTELWDELRNEFLKASASGDNEICEQIIKYYRWCVSPERQLLPNDVQTSAVITFLEKLCRRRESIDSLLGWLTKSEILDYAQRPTFTGDLDPIAYLCQSTISSKDQGGKEG